MSPKAQEYLETLLFAFLGGAAGALKEVLTAWHVGQPLDAYTIFETSCVAGLVAALGYLLPPATTRSQLTQNQEPK